MTRGKKEGGGAGEKTEEEGSAIIQCEKEAIKGSTSAKRCNVHTVDKKPEITK
jgi:hypothetical protein